MFPGMTENWDLLNFTQKVESLNVRVKNLEGKGSATILGPNVGQTIGQASPDQTVPAVDTRLKLAKDTRGNWIVPNNSQVFGGRYIVLPDGSHFDLFDDVDSNGYVTLHK